MFKSKIVRCEDDAIEDFTIRASILSAYYKKSDIVSDKILAALSSCFPYKEVAEEYGVDLYIMKAMLCYTRYTESRLILNALETLGVRPGELSILDFGCLVADYGIFFARRGAKVTLYDHLRFVKFAKFRFTQEQIKVSSRIVLKWYLAPFVKYEDLFLNKDMVIFGEVLEHFMDPLKLLHICVDKNVKFIFTSCYPFGDEAYFTLSAHKKSAYLLQPACQALLRDRYKEIILSSLPKQINNRLWVKKDI